MLNSKIYLYTDQFQEVDHMANQLRHGGDLRGFVDSLDYIQSIGIKGLYLAGSAFINLPWASDGYSPVDLTLLVSFAIGSMNP